MDESSKKKDRRIATGEAEPFECVPHWLLFDARVSGNALRVYLVLRKHRDYDTGKAWPGLTRIAELVGLSVNSVRRLIRDLESVGAVTVTERYTPDGGQTSNLYYVHWEKVSPHQTDDSDPLKPVGGDAPKKVTVPPLPSVVPEQRPIFNEDPTEQDPTNKTAATASAFDEFYTAYPRKKQRGQAEKAWTKAVKHTDPAVIVSGAVQFRQWCERDGKDPQFIPYPSTWLNGKGWLDERDPEPLTAAERRQQGFADLLAEFAYNENSPQPLELEG